jgi:hypothetical protein
MLTTDNGTEKAVDFFVTPKIRESDNKVNWLVYRRSLNVCVEAASDPAAAIAKAMRLAEFCALGGQAAQVHVRDAGDAHWRTVCKKSPIAQR